MGFRIPDRLLVASAPFGRALPAGQVAGAIGRGLQAGGLPEPDLCPLDAGGSEAAGVGEVRALLEALDFDVRMRRARAVVIAAERLAEETLAASVTFEIATRARQGGVPAYAVSAENALDAFDARILDLQIVLRASSAKALTAAGRKLARLV